VAAHRRIDAFFDDWEYPDVQPSAGSNGEVSEEDDDAGDRNFPVLAKPNVIMNDVRLRGLAVAGSDAAGRKSHGNHAQNGSEPQTLPPECGGWCPANPDRGVG
jgi:hypothetical protein